ncbi:hypothetical protein [Methylophilus medardicus]|uniref:Uncharacterized protein n=1 Tax=Methylophilus medardicus TaxID=2588534 RepID=A0A5B8CSE7_9PROT|nr:hypothetical protein [Methylophilus medardicus]QDC44223.1 hypothetical protein FIU01_06610 [Methylophilus medardicus]QDC49230.1 hypothetical protein FIU00_06610 [Methylophilus medardicus]QDC52935.1 hypothetical protein FIT99_06610 [Methylophilus medardicus]
MEMTREEEAQKAYVKLLTGQGVSQRVLVQREFILIRVSAFLKDIPCDGSHYRHAVDRFIASIDPAEIPSILPVIREFFSFWVGDIKAIAAMSQAKVFNGSTPVVMVAQDELFKHWYDLDKTPMTSHETQVMETFEQMTQVRGFEPAVFKERMRMARYLLMSLRHVSFKQSHSYRQMVDRNLPLFNALGSQHTFLSVAREFYYFWRGDMLKPQTAINKGTSTREMAMAA